jgi:hypothetical protein
MSLELLQPVPAEVLSSIALHPPQVLGKNIMVHSEAAGFPELKYEIPILSSILSML